jgi:hypothetical protein
MISIFSISAVIGGNGTMFFFYCILAPSFLVHIGDAVIGDLKNKANLDQNQGKFFSQN